VPEVIQLDPWGYPIVLPGELTDELLSHARRAVAACPALALVLEKGRS
jgi:ferredoxin